MSNITTPRTSTTTNVQPLPKPPFILYFRGNSGESNHIGPAVNPVNGSGMGGGRRSGGGGGAGGHGVAAVTVFKSF